MPPHVLIALHRYALDRNAVPRFRCSRGTRCRPAKRRRYPIHHAVTAAPAPRLGTTAHKTRTSYTPCMPSWGTALGWQRDRGFGEVAAEGYGEEKLEEARGGVKGAVRDRWGDVAIVELGRGYKRMCYIEEGIETGTGSSSNPSLSKRKQARKNSAMTSHAQALPQPAYSYPCMARQTISLAILHIFFHARLPPQPNVLTMHFLIRGSPMSARHYEQKECSRGRRCRRAKGQAKA